jgi:hypothetical protein
MRTGRPLLGTLSRAAARFLPGLLCPPLRAAQWELRRSLRLAASLATTHRRAVCVAPGAGPGHLALRLPEGVRLGRPASIPLPPELAGSGWRPGRPRPLTLLPQRRAAANVWFLHHGGEALCLRLGLEGQVAFLRYRPRLGAWTEA